MLRTNLWSSPICGGFTPGRAVDHRRDGCEYTALVPILCLFYHLQYGINTFHALSALAAGVRRRAGGTEGGGQLHELKYEVQEAKCAPNARLALCTPAVSVYILKQRLFCLRPIPLQSESLLIRPPPAPSSTHNSPASHCCYYAASRLI